LQAGGQWINVSAGGIFSSTQIQLGGAPAPAGAPLTPGLQEKLLAVIPAPLSAVQVLSLKRSAPFCEECERCRNGVCNTPLHRNTSLPGGAP
ncbi:MAG: type VI secretion system tip protein VgrG, partial [Pseudomonas sp.]